MKADGVRPALGESSRTLGARRHDCIVDGQDRVGPGGGGMSVSTRPDALPYFRRPPEWGGVGRDPVWALEASQLDSALRLVGDGDHMLVEPAATMPFQAYLGTLSATQADWSLVPGLREEITSGSDSTEAVPQRPQDR